VIRLLVVDDLRILRETLAFVLDHQAEITVVGTAADPTSALAMVQDLCPDVAVVNIRMTESRELVRTIGASCEKTKLVVLGRCFEPSTSDIPDASVEELVAVVHAAAHGAVVKSGRWDPQPVSVIHNSGLTRREQEILRLIDRGLSNKQIARELNMAVSTVKNHVHSILEKLHVQRRGQAAALIRSTVSGDRVGGPNGLVPRG
jgi:DNA-binding NarL/FixJ family response regulator